MAQDQESESEFIEVHGQAVEQQINSQVLNQLQAAHQFPRQLSVVRQNVMDIVVMDKDTAEACGYALPRDGKTISGPSIHLANIVAQQYGNLHLDQKVLEVGEKTVKVQASAWDLEKNVAIRQEVTRRIVTKTGARYSDDLIVLTANAASSIASRNVIFRIVPRPLWKSAYDAAMTFIIGDVSTDDKLANIRNKKIDKMIATYNITLEDILRALGVNKLENVNADEVKVLFGFDQAIKDNEATVDVIFRPTKDMDDQTKKVSEDTINRIKNASKSKDKK